MAINRPLTGVVDRILLDRRGRLVEVLENLTPAEEVVLRMRFSIPPAEDEPTDLEHLVEQHLILVVEAAKAHRDDAKVPYLDLVLAGMLGLLRAANSYGDEHEEEGVEFVKYAKWYIAAAIEKQLKKGESDA